MRIIFHGDDFGLTSGINKGIIYSFKQGLLSSTSLVASGEAAEEAISLAKENPGLDVGIHLVLCDESPLLPPKFLSSIPSGGSFLPTRRKILEAILARKIDYQQVEAEWRAQIEKPLNAGIPITHIDSHQFVHLFPGLLPHCLRLARTYKIPYMRSSILDRISLDEGYKRLVQCIALKLWVRLFVLWRLPLGIKSVPTIGFLKAGGRMDCKSVLSTIDMIAEKKLCSEVEVMLHPGVGDAYTCHKYTHWQYHWNNDLELLLDRTLAEKLNRRGIEITSYRELP